MYSVVQCNESWFEVRNDSDDSCVQEYDTREKAESMAAYLNESKPMKVFEHPKHEGLLVMQLHYGGQDIRYQNLLTGELMVADAFFDRYGSTLVE